MGFIFHRENLTSNQHLYNLFILNFIVLVIACSSSFKFYKSEFSMYLYPIKLVLFETIRTLFKYDSKASLTLLQYVGMAKTLFQYNEIATPLFQRVSTAKTTFQYWGGRGMMVQLSFSKMVQQKKLFFSITVQPKMSF